MAAGMALLLHKQALATAAKEMGVCVCLVLGSPHGSSSCSGEDPAEGADPFIQKKKKRPIFFFFFFNQIASRSWLDQPHCITYTTVCCVLFPESPHYEQLRVLVHETIDKTKVVDQPSDH